MITISKATVDHAKEIQDIERMLFSDPWSLASIINEISDASSIFFVATEKDIVVGYVSMRHILDEGHISNIAVVETYRKKRIGSLLFDALIAESKARKMVGLTLEVRTSNFPAQCLYQKYGFTVEGKRKNYYSLPTEDALIMWLRF